MRQKSGYAYQKAGKWYARLTFTDEKGKRRNLVRRAQNVSNAKVILKELINELESQGSRSIDASRMTVADLCDYYSEHYCKPAEYLGETRISGLRSSKLVAGYVSVIRRHLGKRLLRSLTHDDLRTFRNFRLKSKTLRGKLRTVATVNREMAYLRRLLTIAKREGWILRNPFVGSDTLIRVSEERRRERILTRDEELHLLEQCVGRREHLRPIIICALDTGMRRGEILKLKWCDLDLKNRLITIQAFNTKTMNLRQVSMTSRLAMELERLKKGDSIDDALVFGIRDTIKTAFNGVVKASGLGGLRFHDLRHCAASRLVEGKMPIQLVGRILGHTQVSTTYRYVNVNSDTIAQAASILDDFQTKPVQTEPIATELVN